MKLDDSRNLINRELSWLEFNTRVLQVALDHNTPLLERLKFLAIVSANLDEFFMVRVGGLRELVKAQRRTRCPAGLTPRQQLVEITRRARAMVEEQYTCLNDTILPALAGHDILRLAPATLDREGERTAAHFFDEELFPVLTPVSVEEDEFPRIGGLRIHIAVRLTPKGDTDGKSDDLLAVIPVPRSWPRFFQLPAAKGYHFVLLEDLVIHYAGRFFPGYEIAETTVFRLTRNADLPLQEDEANDLLEAMSGLLRERKSGSPARLEIQAEASQGLTKRLVKAFEIDPKQDLYRIRGPIDLKPFMAFSSQVDAPDLCFPPHVPQPCVALSGQEAIWDVVRSKDVLLHLPYESFEPVVRFVEEAADDPQVIAIKLTLYRTSEDSPIIAALERAAANGKQVAVLVELKARFDEAQNIAWAERLSEAGAQVVYGVVGLKTHSKILMVVRREADGVRRYVHLSTGNYHDKTARLYEDIGLFTCDEEIGRDASNFFNAVTGYSEPRQWRRLVIAPTALRQRFYALIDREISRSSPENPGRITIKLNSLLDTDICTALCKASRAGVRIRLCVRGICCLRPGIKGLSENIEIISIVGRYLEHSRIFHFRNGGEEEVYLASADWMSRNLDRRIEIMFPVMDKRHMRRLIRVLDLVFSDNQDTWRLHADGSYTRIGPEKRSRAVSCQERLMGQAQNRAKAARSQRVASFRPKGPGKAPAV